MLVILIGGLFLMSTFSRKSQKKRQDERERMMNEDLHPGVWVQTFSGFFGRFVDTDGDVVILETPSGEETYWLKAAVKGVGEPPFEALQDEHDDVETSTETVDVESTDSETDVVETSETVDGDAVDFERFEAQFKPDAQDAVETTSAEGDASSDDSDDAKN